MSRSGGWTRRELVVRGAPRALLAASAIAVLARRGWAAAPPAAQDPARDRHTADSLREFLQQRALSTTEPWLMAHLVLAFGAGVKNAGKPLVDAMVAGSLTTTSIGNKSYPHFAPDIERHPFHFLQILQLVDIAYDRAFATPGGRYTRREILAGSEAVYDPTHQGDEASWTISVLTHEFPPSRDRFTTARDKTVVVAELVEEHLRDTEAAYAPILASQNQGKPYGRGPVHGKACNGAHLIYGLIDALRAGYTGHDLKSRFARLIDATIFRLQLEQRLVDASLRGDDPMIRLNTDAVKLSFLGHFLEDIGYAVQVGVLELDTAQAGAVALARRQLGDVVDRLTSEHDLDQLRANVPNAYTMILGDACHALRGLGYWT